MKSDSYLKNIFAKIYNKFDPDLKSKKSNIIKKLKKLVKKGHMNKDIENDLRNFLNEQIKTYENNYSDSISRKKRIKECEDILKMYINDNFLSEDYIGKYFGICIKDDRIYKCVDFINELYKKIEDKDPDIRDISETIIRYLDDILRKYT